MREGDWTNGCGFSFFCFGFFFSRPRASLFPMRDSLPQLVRFCQSDSPEPGNALANSAPLHPPFRIGTRNRGWNLLVACKKDACEGQWVTVSCGMSIGWRPRTWHAYDLRRVTWWVSFPRFCPEIFEPETCPANAPQVISLKPAPLAGCCAKRLGALHQFLTFCR
jgi:hypothetical protein